MQGQATRASAGQQGAPDFSLNMGSCTATQGNFEGSRWGSGICRALKLCSGRWPVSHSRTVSRTYVATLRSRSRLISRLSATATEIVPRSNPTYSS